MVKGGEHVGQSMAAVVKGGGGQTAVVKGGECMPWVVDSRCGGQHEPTNPKPQTLNPKPKIPKPKTLTRDLESKPSRPRRGVTGFGGGEQNAQSSSYDITRRRVVARSERTSARKGGGQNNAQS